MSMRNAIDDVYVAHEATGVITVFEQQLGPISQSSACRLEDCRRRCKTHKATSLVYQCSTLQLQQMFTWTVFLDFSVRLLP